MSRFSPKLPRAYNMSLMRVMSNSLTEREARREISLLRKEDYEFPCTCKETHTVFDYIIASDVTVGLDFLLRCYSPTAPPCASLLEFLTGYSQNVTEISKDVANRVKILVATHRPFAITCHLLRESTFGPGTVLDLLCEISRPIYNCPEKGAFLERIYKSGAVPIGALDCTGKWNLQEHTMRLLLTLFSLDVSVFQHLLDTGVIPPNGKICNRQTLTAALTHRRPDHALAVMNHVSFDDTGMHYLPESIALGSHSLMFCSHPKINPNVHCTFEGMNTMSWCNFGILPHRYRESSPFNRGDERGLTAFFWCVYHDMTQELDILFERTDLVVALPSPGGSPFAQFCKRGRPDNKSIPRLFKRRVFQILVAFQAMDIPILQLLLIIQMDAVQHAYTHLLGRYWYQWHVALCVKRFLKE